MAELLTVLRVGAGLLGVAYVAGLASLYVFQRSVLYQPYGGHIAPSQAGLGQALEVTLDTPDGERLMAWHVAARPGQPTLLYFHGNAGGLANRAARFALFAHQGWGVFALSYRGFSGSTGKPSEARNVADALLGYDTLRQRGTGAADIVVYGESLGTGIAVQVAVQRPVAGLVLDAPYTSMAAVAQGHYPFFPVRHLIRDRYDSDQHIANVRAPVLIMHGQGDAVIPVAHGHALAGLAREPKTLVIFPHGHHEDLPEIGGVDAIKAWLAAYGGHNPSS